VARPALPLRPGSISRWILGADLLPRLEGDRYVRKEEREVAERALHQLAETAGRNGAPAGTRCTTT